MHFAPPPAHHRRAFFRRRIAVRKMVRLEIAVLNWLALGRPPTPPPGARAGAPRSTAQDRMVRRLERLTWSLVRPGPMPTDALGRALDKYADIQDALNSLEKQALELLPAASAASAARDRARDDRAARPHDDPHEARVAMRAGYGGSTARPLSNARIKWDLGPSFDPVPFLASADLRAAYADPRCLELPRDQWPAGARPARVHATPQELMHLLRKWDAVGALRLVPADRVPRISRLGLFTVYKDSSYDRLILNPTVRNERSRTLRSATSRLPQGYLLTAVHLRPREHLRMCSDDLREFYYTFLVSPARSDFNALGVEYAASDFVGFRAWSAELAGLTVLPCLASLAMGDALAPEVAQAAHAGLLARMCGAMRPENVVANGLPFPRSPLLELLTYDDHATIMKVDASASSSRADHDADLRLFERCDRAYPAVGLLQHPKKRVRDCSQAVIIGAEVEGVVGVVHAPAVRVTALMGLTLDMLTVAATNYSLFATILHSWVQVFMYRRPLLALFGECFAFQERLPRTGWSRMPGHVVNELLSAVVMGPLAVTDFRVSYAPDVYGTDASPYSGAVVRASVGPTVSSELWRASERRGFHSRLLGPAAAYNVEKALPLDDAELSEDCAGSASSEALPRSLSEGLVWHCLESFRGDGNWSWAHEHAGFVVHPGLDNARNPLEDFLSDSVFLTLVALILRRVVLFWHFGPPCLTFGVLRRPRLRSKSCPGGFDLGDPLTATHNRFAYRVAFLMQLIADRGLYASCEQPGSSVMFYMDCFRRLRGRSSYSVTRFCSCTYGSPFMKPFQFLSNMPGVAALRANCRCPYRRKHFIVEGSFTTQRLADFTERAARLHPGGASRVFGREPRLGEPVSRFSGSYPRPAMTVVANGNLAALRLWLDHVAPAVRPAYRPPRWSRELAESLPFRPCVAYRFGRSGHINCLEMRSQKTCVKVLARDCPDSRVVLCQDSRVTIGATAKGRSSSAALNSIASSQLPYIIGAGLYLGAIHTSTDVHRADDPTRDRPIRPPSRATPPWLEALANGDTQLFDLVDAADAVDWPFSGWARLLRRLGVDPCKTDALTSTGPLAAAARIADDEILAARSRRDARYGLRGDLSLGEAKNPGPVPRRVFGDRAAADLDIEGGFDYRTVRRRRVAYERFQSWVESNFAFSFDALAASGPLLGIALKAFGVYLFRSDAPQYHFEDTLNAVGDRHSVHRSCFSDAWRLMTRWRQLEPGRSRLVVPAALLRAMAATAVLWGWTSFAGLLLLGFTAMLHPSELFEARRRDLMLPRDTGFIVQDAFLHIERPKTRRYARMQHGRVSDHFVVAFLDFAFGNLDRDCRLSALGPSSFRRRWDAILSSLGVPAGPATFPTPGSIRGSGATYFYLLTEDVARIQWRGRWRRLETVEFYLQEVAARTLINDLPSGARGRVLHLSQVSHSILSAAILAGEPAVWQARLRLSSATSARSPRWERL